jgi:hypothetical protein
MEQFSALSASLENCVPLDPAVTVTRQDSGHSDVTLRQDSNFSDVTVDSGVVPDMGFNHSQSSSSSISTASFSAPPRPKRHRHKLQRLAAVEDEDTPPPEQPAPTPALRTVKSRLKSSFKSRFYRPAFRIPKCDF